MSKFGFQNLTSENSSLHSTPQGDELTPQQLQDFFDKIAENSATTLIAFKLHPDLDNPSQPYQMQGLWSIDETIADSSVITNIEYHLSLDGTFTDIAASPYNSQADFETALSTEIASDSTFFYIKIGGTISSTNAVNVTLKMIYEGT